MHLRTIVWKELWQRPTAMITGVLAILLSVTALVAIRHVTVFSEREVGRQLSDLGANILILPGGASLQNYYAADDNGLTLPEEHVDRIMLAALTGVEKLSPKLSVPAEVDGRRLTLTGILPQSEFEAKAAWQTASLFKQQHVGCTKAKVAPGPEALTPEALATQRTIENLTQQDAVLGADAAETLHLHPGDSLTLLGGEFTVLAVLPPTGTVDDSRVFAHLHRVQDLAGSGPVVSAIEVMGCCEDAAGGLVPQLGELVPDGKVVTISQVLETQVGVNRLMAGASVFVLVVLVLVGGATVLSTIASNVRERRREIGTLMALGAAPRVVSRLFLLKALWLGIAGGLGGSVLGVAIAMLLGPTWAGVSVQPLLGVTALTFAIAVVVTLLAAYWPARHAAKLDPCICFKEI
ncbi:MAG: ABC transporter permease [Planctomycetota bacterium]|nr:MAG: ABC transporter permease [Planctomycetota bacterium]